MLKMIFPWFTKENNLRIVVIQSFLKNIDVFLALLFCIKLVHQTQKMRKLPTALVHYFYIYPLFSVILGIIF